MKLLDAFKGKNMCEWWIFQEAMFDCRRVIITSERCAQLESPICRLAVKLSPLVQPVAVICIYLYVIYIL